MAKCCVNCTSTELICHVCHTMQALCALFLGGIISACIVGMFQGVQIGKDCGWCSQVTAPLLPHTNSSTLYLSIEQEASMNHLYGTQKLPAQEPSLHAPFPALVVWAPRDKALLRACSE